MATADEIKAGIQDASDADLQGYLADDRSTVQEAARAEIARRDTGPVIAEDYDPRQDPGPERHEDRLDLAAGRDLAPSSDEEVPLEESRKDETTLLATDQVPQELTSEEPEQQ